MARYRGYRRRYGYGGFYFGRWFVLIWALGVLFNPLTLALIIGLWRYMLIDIAGIVFLLFVFGTIRNMRLASRLRR